MKIVKNRWFWFLFSGVLVVSAVVALATFGLKQGIDFTGGTQLSVRFEKRPTPVDAEKAMAVFNLNTMTIQPAGDTDLIFRFKSIDEDTHQKMIKTMESTFGKVTELQYNAIGPAVGVELRQKAISSLVIIFLLVLAFIAWSFRKVSAPVQSWKYGTVVLASAFHDVIIPVGLFALLGKFLNWEIGTPFIAAVLTIMGYSINDTIVVLDRVRENLQKTTGTFEEIVERSIQQTMLRSFNTSMTTILALLAVFFFGGESIKEFALALIVGIATGTYSSIFIIPSLLVTWNKFSHKTKQAGTRA
ncbi:MAG: protein translocase subunit SecF [Patescibacteria group bacterium]